MSLFSAAVMSPPDPILGVADAFRADPRASKINLGVGIYYDGDGRAPLLDTVRVAEALIASDPKPRLYLPIDGIPEYDALTCRLVLGDDHPAVLAGTAVTVQTLGGSGALKVGGDLLVKLGATTVLVPDPTWDNHIPLLGGCGLTVERYRYYDPTTKSLDFEGMLADLRAAASGTVVLLHGCCHNPTGNDLTREQWGVVIDLVASGGLVPFIDLAYQGFADGIEADAWPIREIARRGLPLLCANSFSKTLGLYGERIGGLTLITADADEAARVRSQAKLRVRANYSNPPTHGAAIVIAVLGDPTLRAQWVLEVDGMRDRIKEMRTALVDALQKAGVEEDLEFITAQHGMFSYMGLSRAQMVRLREEFGIFAVESGRLCVAALNYANVTTVAKAIAEVMR